ncbi:MAG: DUF4129 domain-containing transglutaminase family protein, partial [Dehalococcoidia bacterium]
STHRVDVTVTSMLSLRGGDPIFLGGYPVDVSVDHQLEVLNPALYLLTIQANQTDRPMEVEPLPTDIQETEARLNELLSTSGRAITESDIRSALPDDTRLVSWKHTGEETIEVTLERHVPAPFQTVSVHTTRRLSRGDSYEATVLVSTATNHDLLTAGTEYPGWVMDRYLQLPAGVPSRVIDLAQEVAGSADTPYEKAVAIRDYLRTLEYSPDARPPPRGADGVDHFLFELQEGYCSYFASAMTVMLRACGVPSRFVTGYMTEEMIEEDSSDETEYPLDMRETEQRTFVARNSHAWCEVFFPEYGWIPFEPTPGYAVLTPQDFSQPPYEDPHSEIIRERPDEVGGFQGGPTVPSPGETDHPTPLPGETTPVQGETGRGTLPLLVAAVTAAFGTTLWLVRRRLLAEVTEPRLAYSRTGYLAALSGLGPQDNLTPYEYGKRLTTAAPEISTPLQRIVDTYVRSCYGQHGITDEDRRQVAEAWPPVRNHLVRRALRGLVPSRSR